MRDNAPEAAALTAEVAVGTDSEPVPSVAGATDTAVGSLERVVAESRVPAPPDLPAALARLRRLATRTAGEVVVQFQQLTDRARSLAPAEAGARANNGRSDGESTAQSQC